MDSLDIPDFLRREMTPEVRAKLDRIRVGHCERKITLPKSDAFAKNKLRKLRAEERRLSELIDAIGSRDQVRRKHLYALIHSVEREIEKMQQAS